MSTGKKVSIRDIAAPVRPTNTPNTLFESSWYLALTGVIKIILVKGLEFYGQIGSKIDQFSNSRSNLESEFPDFLACC